MKKIIGLIACVSVVVLAQGEQFNYEQYQQYPPQQDPQQQQYQQPQAQYQYQPQQSTSINQQEKIQNLIKEGLKKNKEQIKQEALYLSASEKEALFEQNKKKGAAGWAGLDFGVGFGVGSYVQGDIGFGIAQSIMDGIGYGLLYSALTMEYRDCDRYFYSSSEEDECYDENDVTAITQIIIISASLPVLITSRIMAWVRPFSFQKKYNKTLKEVLNVSGNNVSYSINPLIVPKSSGTPALGLAFNLRY